MVLDVDKMHLTEDEFIQVVRNGFEYSISGRKYLKNFDAWVECFRAESA